MAYHGASEIEMQVFSNDTVLGLLFDLFKYYSDSKTNGFELEGQMDHITIGYDAGSENYVASVYISVFPTGAKQ